MYAVEVHGLSFAYQGGPPVLQDLSFTLARGWRCLLLGANGSGKTTLLVAAGGKALDRRHHARDARWAGLFFTDTALVHEIALLGGGFPSTSTSCQ